MKRSMHQITVRTFISSIGRCQNHSSPRRRSSRIVALGTMADVDGEDGDSAAEPWFYVDARGARQGPHNFRVVRAQLRCGILNASTLVWREGQAEWLACATFPVFASCCADLPGAPARPRADARGGRRDPGRGVARATERGRRARDGPRRGPPEQIPAGATATRAGSERDPPPPPPRPRLGTPAEPRPRGGPGVVRGGSGRRAGGPDVHPRARAPHPRRPRGRGRGTQDVGLERGRATRVGTRRPMPALAAAIDEHRTKTSPPGTTIGTERVVRTGIPGEENLPGDIPGDASALCAALDDERRANASLRADVAHLEAALAAARRASSAHEAESKRLAGALERCGGEAAAYEASRAGVESAEAATARLAEAREALEAKTAELTRLRVVLRGKLLARVTEEADAARANAERLGRAEVWAK